MKLVWSICLLIVIAGCGGADKQTSVSKDSVRKTAKTMKQDAALNDVSVYTPEFPKDTIYPARILTEGTFHNDEADPKDAKLSWMGIFRTDSGYYIAPCKVGVIKTRDVVVDDEAGPETGWAVKTDQKDTTILLIGGLKDLEHRTIEPLLKDTMIYKDKRISFTYNDVTYTVYATGTKKKISGRDDHELRDYQVFIETSISGRIQKQLLASADQIAYEMMLILAGDIDGDGISDLIINTTNHENVERLTLYLSKPANKGKLLTVMGLHTVMGC